VNDLSDPLVARLRSNLASVRARVSAAAESVGRHPSEITLVAVSKYVDLPTTEALVAAGATDLGESRPQSLVEKAERLGSVNWHLIGHLQRNKIRRLLPAVRLIHSIDSERLLDALQAECVASNRTVCGLLEVNLTRDSTKTGASLDQLRSWLAARERWPAILLEGVMGMSSFDADPDQARREFAEIRTVRDRLAAESGLELPILSMGMSGDFEQAIREGSTCVRVGSALFEGIGS